MVEGIGAAEAVIKANPDVKLYGSSSLNVWNHISVKQLSPPFHLLTLSPELSADQLSDLVGKSRQSNLSSPRAQPQTSSQTPAFELLVQGNLEVMVTEDCLPYLVKDKAEFLGLQDFRRIFPLRADDDMRTHFFNSVETCLIGYMPRLFHIGLDGIAIDARGRTGKYAREMAELYSSAIKLTEKEGKSPTLKGGLDALKNEARIRSQGGITSGHFIKGLRDEVPVKTEHHRS
jgi:putative protease